MAKKNKYYVVWEGKRPGIFDTWAECKKMISGYKGARYKSFSTFAEAKKAFNTPYSNYLKKKKKKPQPTAEALAKYGLINYNSIAVDAAWSGNPGRMEYRGVDTRTKKQLFHIGPFPQGTNNIGEFLAIVHGLAFLHKHKSNRAIYTDSRIAMGWIRKKKCNTKLKKTNKNKDLFEMIRRAEHWLKNTSYQTSILKWHTKVWGEIPADFGRK